MINRPIYLKALIAAQHNGFPKVITGVRRCGKSYLLKEIYYNYLLSIGVKKQNIIIVELDDLRNANYRNPLELDKYIRSIVNPNEYYYVFIDEVQLIDTIINPVYTNGVIKLANKNSKNVISFVDLILGLSREKNIDLYVTGSNSKMLSTDIVTEFRDKATNINIKPLSFEEFYNYKQVSELEAIYEYMMYGGMPLAVLKDYDEKKSYLVNLFQATYFKDILDHNNLKKSEVLDELCNIISEECGQLINSEKLSNIYRSVKKEAVDKTTIERYLNYFLDSFLISEAKRYDIKGNSEIGALRKYYFIDNGLRNARLNFAFNDEGQMFENIVYNELIYNGYSVNIGTINSIEKNKEGKSVKKNYEIDFIAKKGIKQFYIQVCADYNSKDVIARETKPFLKLHNSIQKIVVINKPIKETIDNNGFTIIGITDFLLRFIKN